MYSGSCLWSSHCDATNSATVQLVSYFAYEMSTIEEYKVRREDCIKPYLIDPGPGRSCLWTLTEPSLTHQLPQIELPKLATNCCARAKRTKYMISSKYTIN